MMIVGCVLIFYRIPQIHKLPHRGIAVTHLIKKERKNELLTLKEFPKQHIASI